AAQHLVHGRKREAYAELVAATQRAPHLWVIPHYTAYLFRLCDMLEEAILAWKRALEIEPNLPWAYWGLIRGETLLGRPDEGRAWHERLLQTAGTRWKGREPWLFPLAFEGRFQEILDGLASGRFQ